MFNNIDKRLLVILSDYSIIDRCNIYVIVHQEFGLYVLFFQIVFEVNLSFKSYSVLFLFLLCQKYKGATAVNASYERVFYSSCMPR